MHALIVSYEIDASDHLSRLNEGWDDFARTNDGVGLLAPEVLGSRLWDHISDPTIHDIYIRIVKRAREGRATTFRYRCDSARHLRVFRMHVSADDAGTVRFVSTLETETSRNSIALLDPQAARTKLLVRLCSWCHAIAWPHQPWAPLEHAAEKLLLLTGGEVPRLTHGICEPCASEMIATLSKR